MMISIKWKILVSFCAIAAISIGLIEVVVSWKLDDSFARHADKLSAEMITQTQAALDDHYDMLLHEIQQDIHYGLEKLSQNPSVIRNLEAQRPSALAAVLATIAKTGQIDFVLVFNPQGQFQASFPVDRNDLEVEAFFRSWPFGAYLLKVFQSQITEQTPTRWDTFAAFDAPALNLFGIKQATRSNEGTLGIVSADIVKNDFGDPVGLCLVGKLFANYKQPLLTVHELTGAASVIYLDTTPIAQIGFDADSKVPFALNTLQLSPEMQRQIYQEPEGPGEGVDLELTFAGRPYLGECGTLKSFDQANLGILCVGMPKTQILRTQQTMLAYGSETKERIRQWISIIGLGSLGVFALMSLGLAIRIVRPLKQLALFATHIATGDVQVDIPRLSNDEFGALSQSLGRMVASFREITSASKAIAHGDLSHEFVPRSPHDVLGHALQNMSDYLKKIATLVAAVASGDLTVTAQLRSEKDVFGQAIRIMKDGLQAHLIRIRHCAEQIAAIESGLLLLANEDLGIVQKVNTSTKKMIATIHEIGGSVQEVANNMEVLASSVETTSVSVMQMTPAIEHIVVNTDTLAQQIQDTKAFLTETVQALAWVVKKTDTSKQLSQETIQDGVKGQEAIEQVSVSMQSIHATMSTAVSAITSFAKRSQDIGTILDVIGEITEQTSLLALNASIIAAQAGDHGRGFAVVAAEIKNLAGGVAHSTKDIAQIVKTLQQETQKVVHTVHEGERSVAQGMERTQQAQKALREIITSAERSSAVVTEIAAALHALMASTDDVAAALERVKDLTEEIHTATNDQEQSSLRINQAISEINELASQIQHSTTYQSDGLQQVLETTNDITALIDQNFESAQKVTQVTKSLASQAELLLQAVDRFKFGSQ